ncbi:MAG: FAD-dependent oxidoreductase [Chloroflexi bacterium]|nr:FAD-dependent oxidoreductase [Chloroflexota bacterium]
MAKGNYDLIIIGAGSAGLTAAGFAVQLGRSVALVEKDRVGGDCTWTGCVPSKTLLKTARVAHEMRQAQRYGLPPRDPLVDLKAVMEHVKSVVSEVYQAESPEKLQENGIDVFLAPARFLDPHTIETGDSRLTGRFFLIATGARPGVPPIPGIEDVNYLTYETVWDLEDLPRHLMVVGGGPIGCELAQAFCRLGSKVTLLEVASRILPNDDPEAASLIARQLMKDGVDLRFGASAAKAWQNGDGIHLELDGGELVGDALLLATGRRPAVAGMDLEAAGVRYSDAGIEIGSRLRTSRRHIFAAGDCAGGYQFTHYAAWQGFMAVRNAFLPGSTRGVLSEVPWATFTDPEVAHAGLTEADARAKIGEGVMVCSWPMEQVDRALTEGDTAGFLKLVHKSDGSLLGATIVAPRAGEMIQEWILAMERGLKIGDLASSLHIYPTYATASLQVAAHIRVEQFLSGTSGKVIRGLARLAR